MYLITRHIGLSVIVGTTAVCGLLACTVVAWLAPAAFGFMLAPVGLFLALQLLHCLPPLQRWLDRPICIRRGQAIGRN